jgi:hypothetical protein
VKQQKGMDKTTFVRRASLPAQYHTDVRQASPHHAGHHLGLHDESQPYTTRQRPQPGYDMEYDDAWPARTPSSTLRYRDTEGNQVIERGRQRLVIHDEPPPRRKPRLHWSLFLGVGMVAVLMLFTGLSDLNSWWANHQLDATYGMPRTYQTDAIIYPGDSAAHPSHYIFLNLGGTVMIIELPHGDETHARIYKGPTIFSDDSASVPVTGDFREVNGREEMLVHIQDETLIYVNDGTQFRPQK